MSLRDLLQLLLLAAVWGGSFLLMRIAAPEIGPVWLIEMRVLLAGLALLPFSLSLNLLGEVRRKSIPLFIVGCINSAIPFLLFAFASLYLSAGFNGILNATAPLFGTIIAFFWLKERFTPHRIVGFAMGFCWGNSFSGISKPINRSMVYLGSKWRIISCFNSASDCKFNKRHFRQLINSI